MLLSVAFGCVLLYVFYVFALPEVESRIFRWRNPKRLMPAELAMKWSSRNLLRTCEFLFYAWFFYFGASIASFLNVVAWRMPQGRTIVFGGSKCPYCNTRLSFLDNTPVIGWLLVRGRCRTCRLPIAPRYLIIEVVIGSLFVWLAYWELIRGGANLPRWDAGGKSGLTSMVFDPQWVLITAWLAHAGMFAVLIMLAVANEVRRPFPILPFVTMVGILACHKIFFPKLDFVAWTDPFCKSIELGLAQRIETYFNPVLSMLLGSLCGVMVGWVTAPWVARRYEGYVRRHWTLQTFLIGAVLGWQAALTILLGSLVVIWIMQSMGWNHAESNRKKESIPALGLSACLIVVCLLHHSLWRQIAHFIGIA